MSIWTDFLFESRGVDSIENEMGFATFVMLKDKECYIEDVYVKPEFRKKYVATEMIHKIKELAKKAGCIYLTTTANLTFSDPTGAVTAILSYGFKISHATPGVIVFKMEI